MSPPLEQCVADTSVIIDLYAGNLLEILPGLSFRIVIPDIIVENELLEPAGEDLLERGWVEAYEFSGKELIEIQSLWGQHSSLSLADVSALYLASSLKTILLTRDKRLRRDAGQHGVAVQGTLWLLEEILHQQLVRPSRIMLALTLMEARGNFLPRPGIDELLSRWDKQRE
jgi:predicted nucleic acid-binding protein